MHDLALNQCLERMKDLHEVLQRLLLWQLLLSFEIGKQIALITVLKYQVDIVGSFLDIDQSDDVVVLAALEDLYFVLEKFCELA